MMKKFLPFILILVIISGFFSITSKVSAEDKGTCYKNAGEVVGNDVTEKKCKDAPPLGLGGEAWGPNTTTPPGGGGKQTNEEKYRACIADGGSEDDCRSYVLASDGSYHLLQPLPCKADEPSCEDGKLTTFDPDGTGKLGEYLNLMINLFIGLCAVTAVVMIVMGGIEYSTSDLVSGKAAAKDRIQNAILGLLLALCSWLILNTINPDLLNTEIDIGGASITSYGEITLEALPDGTYSSTGGAGAGVIGSGQCKVQTNPNNACSPQKLSSCFRDRVNEASRVCSVESAGGQTGVESGSDKLADGRSYSVGLWQINLTVHQVRDPNTGQMLDCPAAFTGNRRGCGRGTVVPSGPNVGHCSFSVRDINLYNRCVAAAKNPTSNTEAACKIYNQTGHSFQPWGWTAKKACKPPIPYKL